MYIEWKISYFFFISFHRTIFQNILEFRRYICKTTCYSINPTSFICCFGMLHLNIHIFYIYPWCEYSSQLRSLAFIKIFLLADFRRKKNKIRKHPLHFSIYWTLNVKMFIREKKKYTTTFDQIIVLKGIKLMYLRANFLYGLISLKKI